MNNHIANRPLPHIATDHLTRQSATEPWMVRKMLDRTLELWLEIHPLVISKAEQIARTKKWSTGDYILSVFECFREHGLTQYEDPTSRRCTEGPLAVIQETGISRPEAYELALRAWPFWNQAMAANRTEEARRRGIEGLMSQMKF